MQIMTINNLNRKCVTMKKLAIILLLTVMLTGCKNTLYHITVVNENGDIIREYHEVTYSRLNDRTYRIHKSDDRMEEICGGIIIAEPENNN